MEPRSIRRRMGIAALAKARNALAAANTSLCATRLDKTTGWGMLEMWHMQLLAKCDMRNVPEHMGPSQRQVLGHGRKARVSSKIRQRCTRRKPRNGQQRTVGSSLEGGGGSQSCGGAGAGGGLHPQPEGRGQPEEGGATQAAASGKTTGCCEVGAHTNSHTDGQEESESGSGRGEGRSSKGDAPGCVPRVSEIRTADSERPTIHTDQIAEEEEVKTAVGAAAVME